MNQTVTLAGLNVALFAMSKSMAGFGESPGGVQLLPSDTDMIHLIEMIVKHPKRKASKVSDGMKLVPVPINQERNHISAPPVKTEFFEPRG